MLKITRDFYESERGNVVYRWSTIVNGEVLWYQHESESFGCQPPIRALERQARRAFEQAIFNGAFRE